MSRLWAHETKGKELCEVCPTVENIDIGQGLEMKSKVALLRILTGHCGLDCNLFLINKHKDGLYETFKVQERIDHHF